MLTLNNLCSIYSVDDYNTITHNNIVIRSHGNDAGKVLLDDYTKYDYVLEIKNNINIDILFLKLYLLSNFRIFNNLSKGRAIPLISKDDLLNFEINTQISQHDYIKNAIDYNDKLRSSVIYQLENSGDLMVDELAEQIKEIKYFDRMTSNHLKNTNEANNTNKSNFILYNGP